MQSIDQIKAEETIKINGDEYITLDNSDFISLSGFIGIAEYIAHRPLNERKKIYSHLLKFGLDEDEYLLLIEEFFSARSEKLVEILESVKGIDFTNLDSLDSDSLKLCIDLINKKLTQIDEDDFKIFAEICQKYCIEIQASDHKNYLRNSLKIKPIQEIFDALSSMAKESSLPNSPEVVNKKLLDLIFIFIKKKYSYKMWLVDLIKLHDEEAIFLSSNRHHPHPIKHLELKSDRYSLKRFEVKGVQFVKLQYYFMRAVSEAFIEEVKTTLPTSIRKPSDYKNRRLFMIKVDKSLAQKKFLNFDVDRMKINHTSCIFKSQQNENGDLYFLYCSRKGEQFLSQAGYYPIYQSFLYDDFNKLFTRFATQSPDKISYIGTNIEFNNNYGFCCAIASYVQFLPMMQRLKFYHQIRLSIDSQIQDSIENSDDYKDEVDGKPSKEITIAYLLAEEFLKLRELRSDEYDKRDFVLVDQEIFDQSKINFGVLYGRFLKENDSLEEYKYNYISALIDVFNAMNQEINDMKQEGKSISLVIKNSYQYFIGYLISYSINSSNQADIDEKIHSFFYEYFPNSSLILLDDTMEDFKELMLQNIQLEFLYNYSSINPDDTNYAGIQRKIIFHKAYHAILEEMTDSQDFEIGKKRFFKHFFIKQDYEDFFKEKFTEILSSMTQEGEGLESKDYESIVKLAFDHFMKEFSFEKQYYYARNSNPFIAYKIKDENQLDFYATIVTKDRFKNPFTEHESVDSVYIESLFDPKNINTMSENCLESLNEITEEYLAEICSQSQLRGARNESEGQLAPSPTISYRNSTLFDKKRGRKDDNLRYFLTTEDFAASIESIMLKSLDDTKDNNNLNNEEVLIAMLIAKSFGGIGTKEQDIKGLLNQTQNLDLMDQKRKKLAEILFPLYSKKTGDHDEADEIRFNKIKKFSAQFQKQCGIDGLLTGNKNPKNGEYKKYGMRLAFIPDEIVVEYIKKLPKENRVRICAEDMIKAKQSLMNELSPAKSFQR